MRRASTSERERHSLSSAAHQILLNTTNIRENRKPEYSLERLLQELQEKELTILSLKRNYEAISRTFSEERTETTRWQQQLKATAYARDSAAEELSKTEAKAALLQTELTKAQEELQRANKRLEELRGVAGNNRTLTAQLDRMSQEVTEQRQVIQDLFSENQRLKRSTREFDSFKAETATSHTHFASQVTGLSQQVTDLTAALEQAQTQLEEASSQQERIAHEKQVLIEAQKTSLVTIHRLKTQVSEEREELTTTRQKLTQVYTHLQTAQTSLSTRDDLLKLSNLSGKDFKAQITELETALVNTRQALDNTQTEKEALTRQVREVTEEAAVSQQELENAQEDIRKVKAELSNQVVWFTQSRTELEEQLQASKAQVIELLARVREFETEKEQLNARHHTELIEAQQGLLKHSREYDRLKNLTENLQKRCHSLATQVEQLQSTNESLHTSLSTKSSQITDLTSQLGISERALAQAQTAFNVEKKRLEAALAKAQADQKKVDLVVENLNDWQADKQQLYAQLNQELMVIKQENILLKERLGLHKKEMVAQDSTQTKLAQAETIIEQLKIQIQAKDQELQRRSEEMQLPPNSDTNKAMLERIAQLKEGLDYYTSTDRLAKALKSLEKLRNGVSALEQTMSCHSCFRPLEAASVSLPCKHLSCSACKPTASCHQCKVRSQSTVQLPVFDELVGKLSYSKQVLEEVYACLTPN